MNTEKEAILIVNEVLGYVHSKFIREGSAFSQEYVDFRQRHNDRITEIVKQRLETRPHETIVNLLKNPTKADIHNTCLSFRHDYGIIDESDAETTRWQAKEFALAWSKTIESKKGN